MIDGSNLATSLAFESAYSLKLVEMIAVILLMNMFLAIFVNKS